MLGRMNIWLTIGLVILSGNKGASGKLISFFRIVNWLLIILYELNIGVLIINSFHGVPYSADSIQW